MAAEYLAAHLFAAGAEPLGDNDGHGRTFFQSFPLEVVTPLEEGTELDLILEFNGSKRLIPCKLGSEFILRPHGLVPGEVEAPVVFAAFGRINSEQRRAAGQSLPENPNRSTHSWESKRAPNYRHSS